MLMAPCIAEEDAEYALNTTVTHGQYRYGISITVPKKAIAE